MDVVPLFLGRAYDLQIDDEDLIIVLPSKLEEEQSQTGPSVYIHHKPTGISVHSSGAWWFTRNPSIHSYDEIVKDQIIFLERNSIITKIPGITTLLQFPLSLQQN